MVKNVAKLVSTNTKLNKTYYLPGTWMPVWIVVPFFWTLVSAAVSIGILTGILSPVFLQILVTNKTWFYFAYFHRFRKKSISLDIICITQMDKGPEIRK